MANQTIDIGSQPNDGTGDSIYTAFQKVNANFQEIYTLLGFGAGFSFLRLKEAPAVLQPNALLQVNSVGTKFVNKTLVAGTGMSILLTTSTIEIINTASSISSDKSPALAANLSGEGAFSLINMDITGPNADWDAVSRKWIYENFVNRDGVTVYDTTSTSELEYLGRSVIRDNVSIAPDLLPTSSTHLVSKGYVDDKVDNSAYASKVNFFVSLAGDDNRFDLPSWKRGRATAYAFKTINRAARAAEQYIASSQIVLGPYQKTITYSEGTKKAQVSSVANSTILDPASFGVRLRVTLDDASKNVGTDPYINKSIFPGNYVIGAESEAVGLLEAIELDPINGYEYYDISPVDYAKNYRVDLYPVNLLDLSAVKFNLGLGDNIDLPDFWIGHKFTVANTSNNVIAYGTISNITTVLDASGNVRDSFVVDFTGGVAITTTATINENYWHVYAGDFQINEELQWGQKQNKNQCTIVVESGEYQDQYPIKVPENCSIRGDEFRRTIIRPAPLQGTRLPGISNSKWANTYFFRDTQIDGIITAQLNTSTDYASTLLAGKVVTISDIYNDSVTSVVPVTIKDGTPAPASLVGKVFKTSGAIDGQGEIRSVIGNIFYVSLAQNNRFLKQIDGYTAGADIVAGDWHIYEPIKYGYHYLRDASRPVDTLTTITNEGGFTISVERLTANKQFIAEEAYEFMKDLYESLVPSQFVDEAKCKRDLGIIVDSLAYDLKNGGNHWTLNAGDSFNNLALIKTGWASTATAAAITYINTIGQLIIDNDPVVPVRGSEAQVSIPGEDEHDAGPILADLVQACRRVFLNDPQFNPPKYNDEMDVFLMNDATINRYISAQGHGGFMKVLDPDGQILAKSPYTQTASSFSRSKNRQVFAGGMFIDGFAGNTISKPATIENDSKGNPVKINITQTGGLGRPSVVPGEGYLKPQVPCFFVHKGVTYEVSFIGQWNPTNGTGSLNLNPLRPGGISSITNFVASGFKTGGTITVPVRFSAPTQTGGLNSTGTAVINAAGQVTAINVAFPGSGYNNGSYNSADEDCPKIVVGGARISWTLNTNGSITNYAIIDGGQGYTTGTVINFPGAAGGTTATAVVATVDGSGAIQTVTVTNSGSNYLSDPSVTFGSGLSYNLTVKAGFNVTAGHPLPSELTLITAGNRSMLANDFTQMNDLGYGIFCTNGGLVENVSMFTYYCYSAYYALNGAQCRSIAGSTSYGLNGLKAEGSDPNEVPIAVRNKYAMNQIATVNSTGAYVNQKEDSTIVVDGVTYPPLSQSQLEINHSGIIKLYNIKSAVQVETGIYSLSIDDGTGKGLFEAVPDNASVVIRIQFNQLLLDVNAATLSRPSTVLTYAEDPSYVYRILQYTNKGADTAEAEGDSSYNYILLTTYTEGGLFAQGLGEITITNGGSGYTPNTQIAAVIPAPSTAGAALVNGTQANTDLVTISGASGTIMVGSRITFDSDGAGGADPGGNDPGGAAMYVVWVNDAQTQIRTSREWTWPNGYTLAFTGIQATGYGVANSSGVIDRLVLTNQGAGYAGYTVRNITFASGAATATAYPTGIAGTKKIKIVELDTSSETRIETGLANGYYYTFGHEGNIYRIAGYKNSIETGNAWAEVTVERLSDSAALQKNVVFNTYRAGITANQPGDITVRISTMRVTGHDMLYVGTGGYADSKYPNDLYGPPNIPPDTAKETQEVGKGRVYYATTDQDGNFKVGKYFGVDQGRGTVSISAPISLTNVDGISFRRGQTLVQVFSVDGTMGNNSNNSVPTERAIVSYVNSRLGLNRNNTTAGVTPIGSGFLDRGGVLDMKANIKMDTNRVTNMGDPVDNQDAVTKSWAEARYVNTSGDTMVGTLNTEIVLPRLNNQYTIGSEAAKYTNMYANNFRGNADTASKWANARTLTLSGDLGGSVSFSGDSDFTLTATIQANSVALGTDTTGDYVSNGATSGHGLSGSTTGETQTFTVTSNATNTNAANTLVFRDPSGNFSAATISAALNGNAATSSKWADARTVTFSGGDVTGSFSIDGGANVSSVALTIEANSVALGTDTTGQYAQTVAVSGTGLSCTAANADDGTAYTISSNATNANTGNTIVARDASGNFSAGTITANLTGTASAASAVVGSLIAGSYLTGDNYNGSTAVTWSVNATSANTGGAVVARDGSGNFSAGVITATATSARYADLAEKYLPDGNYTPGTVVVFGGTKEITIATEYMDRRIAGVISTNPAYMMNNDLEGGVYVALTGRVPCKVVGKIRKGDMLVAAGATGVATAEKNPALGSVIGKALEDYDSQTVGIIEVVVGRI